jgi:hypothetical protein
MTHADGRLHAELAAMSLDSRGEFRLALLIHVRHSKSEIRRDSALQSYHLSRRRSYPLPKCAVAVLFSRVTDRTARSTLTRLAVWFPLTVSAGTAPHQFTV